MISRRKLTLLIHYATIPESRIVGIKHGGQGAMNDIRELLLSGLLEQITTTAILPTTMDFPHISELVITEKGMAYIAAIEAIPLPVQETKWVVTYPKGEE